MDITFKPPRWARSYVELMTFIQDLGVEVDEGRVLDRIMDECVVITTKCHASPQSKQDMDGSGIPPHQSLRPRYS